MPGLCLQGVELVRFGSLDRARGGHLEGYLRKYSNRGQGFFCLELLGLEKPKATTICMERKCKGILKCIPYWQVQIAAEEKLEQQYPEFL